jgi:hypothetical protein
MASDPSPSGTLGESGAMSYEEFEHVLREATASAAGHGLAPGSARISELRRALRGRCMKDLFETYLCRLKRDGILLLEAHAHPASLAPSDVEDALNDGERLLYFLRWLK